MNKDEALDLALEALENLFGIPAQWTGEGGGDVAVWRLGGSHRAQAAITAIKQARALDKKAENARELGLDYEPAPMSQPNRAIAYAAASKLRELGYEWVADAWKQPAQQEKEGFASPGGGYVPAIPRPIPLDWKLVPRKATPEMLRAMDECAQEGYDERLYEGMASSVYMAAWDASPVLGTLPPSEKERSMMDIIVGNLVREGINKHRARELAEHFIKHTSPPARQRHISYACPQCHWSLEEQPAQRKPLTPTKCWKCGDSDPAFTELCQVPACGMKD